MLTKAFSLSPQIISSLCLLLVCSIGFHSSGCREHPLRAPLPLAHSAHPKLKPNTPNPFVSAHLWSITTQLELAEAGPFARLTHSEKEALKKLTTQSTSAWQIEDQGSRLLLTLPRAHPAGPSEILFASDEDRLVLYQTSDKLAYVLSRDRLSDILAWHPLSSQQDFEATLEPLQTSTSFRYLRQISSPVLDRRIKTSAFSLNLAWRYFPKLKQTHFWPMRIRFEVFVADIPRELVVQQEPLLQLALPILQNERGLLLLEYLSLTTGLPLAWTSEIINNGKPTGTPPIFHTKINDLRFTRVPLERFSSKRAGYRQISAFPTRREPGYQIISPEQLAQLRHSLPRDALIVQNKSNFAALIHLDGLLLGWVGPNRQMSFKGLPEGYYRLYAVSPTGVRYWGPYDLYLPGPLTLN